MHGGVVIKTGQGLLFVIMVLSKINDTTVKVCTGSVIGPQEVITAAHCVIDTASSPKNTIIAPAKFRAKKIIVHPGYVDRVANDLAVVKVDGNFSNWVSIGQQDVADGDYCDIAGYGDNGSGKTGSLGLLKVSLLPKNLCSFITGRTDLDCSAQSNGVEPCEGDSGGPLMCNGVLTGVISRGISSPPIEKCGKHSLVIVQYENVEKHLNFVRTALASAESNIYRRARNIYFWPLSLSFSSYYSFTSALYYSLLLIDFSY